MTTLKKVSGRLRELIHRRQKILTPATGSRRLLVIDDEESIRFSLSEYFSSHGFEVDTAHSINEAESLIRLTHYHVIIQDLRLGLVHSSDGIDLIRLAHQWNPEARIIVLTSESGAELEQRARQAGADAFLHKPKPLSQVAQVVHGLIDSPRKRGVSVASAAGT